MSYSLHTADYLEVCPLCHAHMQCISKCFKGIQNYGGNVAETDGQCEPNKRFQAFTHQKHLASINEAYWASPKTRSKKLKFQHEVEYQSQSERSKIMHITVDKNVNMLVTSIYPC